MDPQGSHPTARTTGLVVKTLGPETLVYDLETHRAHRLNAGAAAVWRQCDGARDVARISAALHETGAPMPEDAVRYALGELGHVRLLTAPVPRTGVTRRELLRRLGLAAAALPAVTTILAPTAAQAQSCLGAGGACVPGPGPQCCAGFCLPAGICPF